MPPIISVTTAQAVLHYTGTAFESGGGATVLGFKQSVAWTVLDLQELAVALRDAWLEDLQDVTSEMVTLSRITAVSASVGTELGVGVAGEVGDATTPPNTALLVSYKSATRGPRGRGRSYLPGLTFESSTGNDGVLAPSQLTALQGRIDAFWTDVEAGAEWQQVIIQNSEGESPPLTPPPPVNSRTVSNRVATQRRRLRR